MRNNSLTFRNKHITVKGFLIKIILLLVIMTICTIISKLFITVKMLESNIVMIYLLGIILFTYLAGGYIYSLLASICGVLFYNYFFTEPYYTFLVYKPEYPITFLVLFTVALIISVLTIKVKLETKLAEDREKRIKSLYYIGKRLLEVKCREDLAIVVAEEISKQLDANTIVQFFDSSGSILFENIVGENVFKEYTEVIASREAYQSGSSCGYGTTLFSNARAYYTPILGKNGVMGIIGICLPDSLVLTSTQRAMIDAIVPQIAAAIERERLYEKHQESQLEIQRERLRVDMLRAISHDLRTPLTGIMGLASTVLEDFDKVSDDVKKGFLKNIFDDADWLNGLVENILQATRFDEGRVKLNMGKEAAEEIITDAVLHVKKRALGHKIKVNIPKEIILLRVDGVLIRQVLVNLLNNAINFSPQDSEVIVSLYRDNNNVIFEVMDNGPGISELDLPHIFERFYRRNDKNTDSRQGIGLGLSLCKSIIEAHKGNLSIRNHEPHGTIASFNILSEKEW